MHDENHHLETLAIRVEAFLEKHRKHLPEEEVETLQEAIDGLYALNASSGDGKSPPSSDTGLIVYVLTRLGLYLAKDFIDGVPEGVDLLL